MTQTILLIYTLTALALMPVGYWSGYFIGWLTHPNRIVAYTVHVAWDVSRLGSGRFGVR